LSAVSPQGERLPVDLRAVGQRGDCLAPVFFFGPRAARERRIRRRLAGPPNLAHLDVPQCPPRPHAADGCVVPGDETPNAIGTGENSACNGLTVGAARHVIARWNVARRRRSEDSLRLSGCRRPNSMNDGSLTNPSKASTAVCCVSTARGGSCDQIEHASLRALC
jgi:hypothetical protein